MQYKFNSSETVTVTFFLSVVRTVALSCSWEKRRQCQQCNESNQTKERWRRGGGDLTFWMISGVIPTCSLTSIGSPPAPWATHIFQPENKSICHTRDAWDFIHMINEDSGLTSWRNSPWALTTAAGWEAGATWGATNPAWGFSVAKAAKVNITDVNICSVCMDIKIYKKSTKYLQCTSLIIADIVKLMAFLFVWKLLYPLYSSCFILLFLRACKPCDYMRTLNLENPKKLCGTHPLWQQWLL